jgi:hypothetical protein
MSVPPQKGVGSADGPLRRAAGYPIGAQAGAYVHAEALRGLGVPGHQPFP